MTGTLFNILPDLMRVSDKVPSEVWSNPVLHPKRTVPIIVTEEIVHVAPVADVPPDEVM